jgi:hypothetical protein
VHFGGGAAAVPAPPVRPRGVFMLVLLGLLAVGCLVLVIVAATRITAIRRARRAAYARIAGAHSASFDPEPPSG